MWPFDTVPQPQTLEDFRQLYAEKEAWKSASDQVPPDEILWALIKQGVKAPVAPTPMPVGIASGTSPGQTQPSSFTPGGFMDFFVRNVIGMPSPVPGVSVPAPLPQGPAPQGGPAGFMKKPGQAIAKEAAQPEQTGGWAYFGPPVGFGEAEKIAATEPHRVEWLPKASPEQIQASGPDAELQQILATQPFEALQNFERNMGNKGINPPDRPLHRGYLADMMTRMGIMDDAEAATYIEHGMGEDVARMKLNVRAQEAAKEAQKAENLLAVRRLEQGPTPSVPTEASMKREEEIVGARLKAQGKWAALFINPRGQMFPDIINKVWGKTRSLGETGTNTTEIDEIVKKGLEGKILTAREREVADNVVVVGTGGAAALTGEKTLHRWLKELREQRTGAATGRQPPSGAAVPPPEGPLNKEAIAGFEAQAAKRARGQ